MKSAKMRKERCSMPGRKKRGGVKMLGGSFGVGVIRNCLGACVMLSIFYLLDRPRFSRKKTKYCYILFGLLSGTTFSCWYILDSATYMRFSGLLSIPTIGIFGIYMSRDTLYLAFYKLTLGFYLLALTVFCGIDISRIFFNSNLWADIVIRILVATGILFFIALRVRKPFLDGIDYLREELDWFSAITIVVSILIAALVTYWPRNRTLSFARVFRIILLFFMSGVIQYLVFQVYLHRGKERRYQVEKELLETNERLIQGQLELMRESKDELSRIRHDARHHCRLIEEYINKKETDKLAAYIHQYREELESRRSQAARLGNETIHNILSVYIRRAKEKNIDVTVQSKVAGNIPIKDIDLVAVIANIFENAIHGCNMSFSPVKKIHFSIKRKGNKIVIQCKNTCSPNVKLKHGLPVSDTGGGTGILSILKVASFYNGEAAFSLEEGMFVVRILLNASREENK